MAPKRPASNEHLDNEHLDAEDVDLRIDPNAFGFADTSELSPRADGLLAQPRALRALELGLAIRDSGYNIYLAGLNRSERKGQVRDAITKHAQRQPTPPDWVYVNDFDRPERPWAISLSPGEGMRLKRSVDAMLDRLADELPQALQQEEPSRALQRLGHELQEQAQELSRELEALAKSKGLAVRMTMGGLMLVPLREGRPMSDKEISELSEDEQREIRDRQAEVAEHASALTSRQQELQRRLAAQTRELEREFAARHIDPLVQSVAQEHRNPRVHAWLERAKQDMVHHLEHFRPIEDEGERGLLALASTDRLSSYRVNVVVDNGSLEGAPIVIEDCPNYKNLFGVLDRRTDALGRSQVDFTRIRAGSLLRASGGYLVFDIVDALMEPAVWKELKRGIKAGSLQIQEYEPMGIFSISALQPEPIPLDVKLVACGLPRLYHMLYLLDEDFREVFKVKAEIDPHMARSQEEGTTVGRLIASLDVRPFDAPAIAELVRAAARMAGDRRKLTAELGQIADLAREADYWAGNQAARRVRAEHVRTAVDERVYRSDLIARHVTELIEDGALRITCDGEVAGQINAMSVVDLGDYAFGRPLRLTAGVGVGAAGLINIERESKLSGSTFDKSMLILEGYLRNKYANDQPLALSASLAVEQSYGMIEGDSASVAELLCLLSALAETPLRQDIAVTGSVNQWGQVQAVGGVNEKIEGFFDVCRLGGLTGAQGVIIPASNVRNVILRPDVVGAIEQNHFHVWAIEHVDRGLELLSGLCAGTFSDDESVHGRVAKRLRDLADVLDRRHAWGGGDGGVRVLTSDGHPHADPRPRLPGNH
jgi:predicted ATP-dependent protease